MLKSTKAHWKKLALIPAAACMTLALSQGAMAETKAEKAIQAALESSIRSDDDKKRDEERKPLETLTFFGLTPDMSVIELFPGHGWYTKVLGNTLKEEGQLYVAIATDRVKKHKKEWGLDEIEVLSENAELKKTDIRGVFNVENLEFDKTGVDMVVTFRNMHNFTPEARAELNKKVFDALKPGGVYAVLDHTRRHMQPYSRPVWRRVDPVLMIKEIQDAGFEFVDYSDLHYNDTDALEIDTRNKKFEGYSDRFTLKFKKPE